MNDQTYEILRDEDGTFTVEIHGPVGTHSAVTGFDSREAAVEWVRQQNRKRSETSPGQQRSRGLRNLSGPILKNPSGASLKNQSDLMPIAESAVVVPRVRGKMVRTQK